jgi:hypothetical protein
MHGINDECGSGIISMIKEIIIKTGKNSKKTIFVDCIIESRHEYWTSQFKGMKQKSIDYCEKVKSHPVFGNSDFNIIGLS